MSHVNRLFTANTLDGIAAPLRPRLDIVEAAGPGEEHFEALLTSLTRDLGRRRGVAPVSLPLLAPAGEDLLRLRFFRTRPVRRLAREPVLGGTKT